MLDRNTIQELNELSLEVFGTKSKWRKLVDDGVSELIEEDTTRLNADGSTEKVKTPLMHVGKSGGEVLQHRIVHYTPETIKEKMLSIKQQRDEMMVTFKKQQEAAKAAEEAKKAVEAASGSSL